VLREKKTIYESDTAEYEFQVVSEQAGIVRTLYIILRWLIETGEDVNHV
jgi:hypothetical protein